MSEGADKPDNKATGGPSAGPESSPVNNADSARSAPAESSSVESAAPTDLLNLQTNQGRRIAIAIVAMGGQGGGVLADWIVVLAEANGWIVQNTSVPGVAQRTGATIYYVELFEPMAGETAEPVLALMPGPGDVDLVIAAEWMEAGRAITRGLVTPDRTTFVASTHRAYATVEKMVPGNGMADSGAVWAAAELAARELIAFDMAQIASDCGTVISATLFGAVAATDALPFELAAYEAAIKSGGVGVDSSLKGLHASYEAATQARVMGAQALASGADNGRDNELAIAEPVSEPETPALAMPSGPLGERLSALPVAAQSFALEGARRCVDYLDADYASLYLDRLEQLVKSAPDDELITELARWLALRMCYEDPIRVADLKTRRTRFADIRGEVRAARKQIIHHTEFMHPRLEEITDTLPTRWGERLQGSPMAQKVVMNWFGKGLLFRTSTLRGFASVWVLSRLGHWRRQSIRHTRETAQIEEWLATIERLCQGNLPLGRAMVRTARVIKGYGDTHARSMSLYSRLAGIANGLGERPDGGAILDYLLDAALADADGTDLDKAVAQLNEHDAGKDRPTGIHSMVGKSL